MDYRRFLSQRCGDVEFSGIRKVFDLAARTKNAIDFSIGQPDFDAPTEIKDAAVDAIRSGRNRYTQTAGVPELRAAIAAKIRKDNQQDASVLVTGGVSGGLTLAMLVTMGPGDEAVFVDPYFVSYPQLVRMMGGAPVAVPSYPDFRFPAAAIERAITPRTKLLLISSPANPTGRVMTVDEMKIACDTARKHNLLLVSDEIYADLVYDGPNPCPADFAPERTILLRGFGKNYGVTGWRMGYVAGPAALVEEMTKMQQYTFVCANSAAQYAVLDGLTGRQAARVADQVARHREDYANKRDLAMRILSAAFEIERPRGGFYIYPKSPARFGSATAFCEAAAARDVLIIPGRVFSAQDTHFRISYAVSDETLQRGCEILCQVARG